MNKKIWINKSDSHEAAQEFDFEYYLSMSSKERLETVQFLREEFYKVTKDIDILIDSSPENAKKIIRALTEFGFEDLDLSEDDLCQEGNIIQLGYEPLRVDIVTSLSGTSFDQVWKNKVGADYGREKVYFIGLDDLIQTKKQSSRPQDKVDLDLLIKAKDRK
jgi:hypothetical protein